MANTSIKTIKPFSNNDNQEKLPIATLVTPQESKNMKDNMIFNHIHNKT